MSKQADILPTAFFFRGEDREWRFTIYQLDNVTPQDLTGWTLEYTMRDGATTARPVITKAMGVTGVTIDAGTGGTGKVAIAEADTKLLSAGKYWHQLRRTNAGSKARSLHGDVHLLAGG